MEKTIETNNTDFERETPILAKTIPMLSETSESETAFPTYTTIRTWIEKGMLTKKMIFGLPFHGWAWKLERSYNHNVFSPAQGPAQGQNISMEGLIEYRNIKKFIVDNNNNATNVLIDHKYPIAYTHCDNTWIAYESEESITAKIAKVKINLAMLGYFVSNIAAHDDHDSLSKAASRERRKSYGYYWW
uniref:GH18 domain-containing protein n=1 Tax=Cucumis melo TaxID=3656 RepID=A0A9I9EBP7_CUCME